MMEVFLQCAFNVFYFLLSYGDIIIICPITRPLTAPFAALMFALKLVAFSIINSTVIQEFVNSMLSDEYYIRLLYCVRWGSSYSTINRP